MTAFEGPAADFVDHGTVNSHFEQGPPVADAPVETVDNPIPYWYSQGELRWEPGAVVGQGTIEQIIPVSKGFSLSDRPIVSDGDVATALLDASGAYTDAEPTFLKIKVAVSGRVTHVRMAK